MGSFKALDYNSQGNLCLNGTELQSVLKPGAGPSYIYSRSIIKSKWQELKDQFQKLGPDRPVSFYYATKANFHPEILKLLFSLGLGADVVSGGELKRVLENGLSADKIIFSGVGKSQAEIEYAIEVNIGQINVESLPEIQRILNISQRMAKKVKIGIRVNPDVDPKTHPSIATGLKENKFGIDLVDLEKALALLKDSPWVQLVGLSIHIGSQISDIGAVTESISRLQPFYAKYQWPVMDLGGGFRVSYQHSNEEDTKYIPAYSQLISQALSWYKGKVCFEPGRFLVARAGVLVSQIEYIKKTAHKNFLILNSGMNHFMRPALYSAEHRIFPLKSHLNDNLSAAGVSVTQSHPATLDFDIVGPICESSDVILRNSKQPAGLQSGDWMAIADVGAYGFVMASHYNLFNLPEEIFID